MPDPAKFAQEFPAAVWAASVGPSLVLRCVTHPDVPMSQPAGVKTSLLACPVAHCTTRVILTLREADGEERPWPSE